MRHMRVLAATILLGMALCQVAALASDRIEVLQLHQRGVAQVIPLVKPLLRPDESVSGTGFQLILRAGPKTIAEVRKLLERIDAGLKNLVILVTHEDMSARSRSQAGANNRYHSEYGGSVAGHADQQQRIENVNIAQRIRVVEGNPARLHAGTAFLNPSLYGTNRQDIGSGVMVIPRLNGERVNLEIQPYRERLQRGTGQGRWIGRRQETDVQRLSTVVSGNLGQWIFLGGVVQNAQAGSRQIFSSSRHSTNERSGVWVNVLLAE